MAAGRDSGGWSRHGLALWMLAAVGAALCQIAPTGTSVAADGARPRGAGPGAASEPDGDPNSYWTLYRQRRLMSDARLLEQLDLEFCAFRDAESRALEHRTGHYEDRPSGPLEAGGSLKRRGVFFEDDCALFIKRHADEHRAWYAEAEQSAHGDTVAAWHQFCTAADPRQPLRSLCRGVSNQQASGPGGPR